MKRVANYPYLIGIDEAGRGPIAGPIAVGAFVFLHPEVRVIFKKVKESKQLSEEQRDDWFSIIESACDSGHVNFAVSLVSHSVIDSRGVTFSVKKGIEEALKKLKLSAKKCTVILDGLLKAPARYKKQRTIIGGDDKYMAIALASICAKVTRDRHMRKVAKKLPLYGFDRHKGYGTSEHYDAIRAHGLSPIHRRRFLTRMFEKTDSYE